MHDFLTVWRSGTALEAPEAIAVARRFTLDCVREFLRRRGVAEARWRSIEQGALLRYLVSPERVRYYGETPQFEADGMVLCFKAFSGERFGRYERVMLSRPNRGPIGLVVRIPLETQDDVHFSLGPIYAGLLWLSADPGTERSGIQTALAEAWGEEPAWFSKEECGEQAILGWRVRPAEWDGSESELVGGIAHLLTSGAAVLDQLQPGQSAPGGVATARSLHERLLRSGYRFSPQQVATFYAALKAKGFVILSGLSGTGKTKLALEFAAALGLDDNHFLLEPVKPDWRDNTGLMGYWNPVTEEYVATRFLRFLLAAAEEYERTRIPSRSEDLKGYIRRRLDVTADEVADAEEDTVEDEPQEEPVRPYIVVLDEMNLARVEYYLADVLSVLESGRREDGFTRGEIYLHGQPGDVMAAGGLRVPPRLRLPPNLYFVGTVNVDETTFAFSPKVLDRAFTIEVKDVDLTDYPPEVDPTGRPAGVAAAGRPVRERGV